LKSRLFAKFNGCNSYFLGNRSHKPITIYQSDENSRFDPDVYDFGITSDLGVNNERHFRLPIWMGSLDWSHEGVNLKKCPRYGARVEISNLMRPLGDGFMAKPRQAVLVCSHLLEPRRSLFDALASVIPVTGYGKAFDRGIPDHNSSGFTKIALLQQFGFSLCPENSLYPGYYTEKIPEVFNAGVLPISWCDENVANDFNTGAFINLLPYARHGYQEALHDLLSPSRLLKHAEQPLLKKTPTLDNLRLFTNRVIDKVL
jgi:hypothetical protein